MDESKVYAVLDWPCRKLSPRYVGPFQITHQITPVSFELNLPNHYRISPTFHVSLLKPADGTTGTKQTTDYKPHQDKAFKKHTASLPV